MEEITVLIVEDELITAESINELLLEEDYLVTGVARDATAALRISGTGAAPAVVICDINIKGTTNGTELAAQLKKLYNCEIVFLTAHSDARTLAAAFSADPAMYVVKPYTDKQLLIAVQMAVHNLIKKKQQKQQPGLQLTEREIEIAQLVAEGFSSKQIARKLSISIETVKTHRRRMLSKNNISSFPHLVYLMNREG